MDRITGAMAAALLAGCVSNTPYRPPSWADPGAAGASCAIAGTYADSPLAQEPKTKPRNWGYAWPDGLASVLLRGSGSKHSGIHLYPVAATLAVASDSKWTITLRTSSYDFREVFGETTLNGTCQSGVVKTTFGKQSGSEGGTLRTQGEMSLFRSKSGDLVIYLTEDVHSSSMLVFHLFETRHGWWRFKALP
jgi:hypothetical protein